MTILTKRVTWARPKLLAPARTPDLTDDERANVKAALRFLRTRAGGGTQLAEALGVSPMVIRKTCARRGEPTVAIALRVARHAGVALELVLSGAWPGEGLCPHCGRQE